MTDFHATFEELIKRIAESDLRVKPNKLKLNVVSADILGLHWTQGKLTPSHHKLNPLACCSPPITISGLRGWLGGVRFNQVCLAGTKLALSTKLLDELIPSSKSGKERITWTPQLLQAFQDTQSILKSPLLVTVPRAGDTPYLVTDACTTLPARGTKLFLKRPGVKRFLPSFNW